MSSAPCPDCFTGTLSTKPYSGTTNTIHGLPTYIAQPGDGIKPKGLVVIISDAFGWELANNRVLADTYARKGGLLVYLPDFMSGNAMQYTSMDLVNKIMAPGPWYTTLFLKPVWILRALLIAIPWMYKTRLSVTRPLVFNFFKALRSSPPPFATPMLKIGAAGFCFGGGYTILLAADTPSSRVHQYADTGSEGEGGALAPLIDCAFTAHPSNVDVPTDIQAVKVPLSVCVGKEDMAMKAENIMLMKEILEKKGDENEVVLLEGAKHGFAIRMDPGDEVQIGFAAVAERQALLWFEKWLA